MIIDVVAMDSVVARTKLLTGHGSEADDALRATMTDVFVASANARMLEAYRRDECSV